MKIEKLDENFIRINREDLKVLEQKMDEVRERLKARVRKWSSEKFGDRSDERIEWYFMGGEHVLNDVEAALSLTFAGYDFDRVPPIKIDDDSDDYKELFSNK